MRSFLELSPEVKNAIESNAPVVALESTIISHGMPYPKNLETALSLENVVREHDAIPATIAVIDGKIKVGLSREELEFMAKAKDVLKLSRMDLPYAISQKKNGATTVAATMICAHLAGIKVFATGGVGGVHRSVEKTFDISADLFELSKTPVLVVSAGVKSILDIPKTLEVLETLGVTVVGYKTEDFPSFYSRSSGSKLYMRVDTPKEAANLFETRMKMGIDGGMLLANPISKEEEIEPEKISIVIKEALLLAEKKGISGKDVTPFLLSKIVEKLPQALDANISLVKSNAALAAEVAKNL
ncbi:pseudouridine-5'-phosphate glycosidase [Mesoaciditoga lauensis]|uniref:pseudouridine-5'-phosphate glycosidase n=1 Tax=Mesoaciditoga lauensis TaxID=1495039 RepID=UPI00056740A0|nr:pseudouridine-5'-phosphate glycosidase [Mesoaciditoga lauensis]